LRTVRFAAATELRSRLRRQRHEQEAHMQSMIEQEGTPSPEWERIAPLLDEALATLGATDRDAVVLRYIQQMPLKEVGVALRLQEAAAQKRISRAVDKLRAFFARRHVTV